MTAAFLSYHETDRSLATDFARREQRTGLRFSGRFSFDHQLTLDPEDLGRSAERHLTSTSLTIVLISWRTQASPWVAEEIEWSLEKDHGLLGVKLESEVKTPDPLYDVGAEILDWQIPEDVQYFDRAVKTAVRAAHVLRRAAEIGTGSGSACARPLLRPSY